MGAAGLLLARRDASGRITHVVLQHRAPWSDQGGTWGIPGGAREPGESAVDELRADLVARVDGQLAVERAAVGAVLADDDLASDAASRLRLRLAVLKGLT